VSMRKGKRTFASRKRKIAGLCALVLAGVIGVGAYAFTASNTVRSQSAGGGTSDVSGYKESGVSYTWSVDGKFITAVEFELEGLHEPSDVAVALSKANPPAKAEWVDCPKGNISAGAGGKWLVKCEFKGNTKGAHVSTAAFGEDYKWAAEGVPNAEGIQLSISAVSEGVTIVEGS
jgi:hypothetical protein